MNIVSTPRWATRVALLALLVTSAGQGGWAASGKPADAPQLLFTSIPRVDHPLTMQEVLSGEAQRRTAVVKDFVQYDPKEGVPASQPTTAYLAYDDKNLYAGFLCEDRESGLIRAHVTRRDAIGGDDHVGVIIDTYYDHRRGYAFSANPHGIQADAIVDEMRGDDSSFDTLWNSEGQLTPGGYAVLMTIPFRSLRFSPEEKQTWGIFLSRSIPRLDESSTWPPISRGVSGWLTQEAEVRGLDRISPGKNFQLTPYGFFSSRRYLNDETGRFVRDKLKERLGLDAKWVVASNLTLDATVNPDFSQVESDQPQITVNRRFEVFFPELRPFFLENSRYFDTPTQVVFTRRIVDPQFGVKLTGKTGPYTIAGLVADDRGPGETVAPDDPSFGHRAFFDIFRVSRDIHRQSNLGMIWSDREFMGSYNRVLGVDGRWKFSKNSGLGFQTLKTFSRDFEGDAKQGHGLQFGLDRFTRHWSSWLGYNERSPDFEAASGFFPRINYRSVGGYTGYAFRPEGNWVFSWQPYFSGNVLYDCSNVRQDYSARPGFWVEFAQLTHASGQYHYKRERYEGNDFLERGYEMGVQTWRSRWFSSGLYYSWGEEINFSPPNAMPPYLGQGDEVSFRMTVRPTARLAVEHTVLENRFQTIEQGRNIFNNNIFRSRWNYQFTPRLSLRVIGQYANVLPGADLTSLDYAKTLTGDVLFTYLVHPGTALYVGYNNMMENYDRAALAQAALLERTRMGLLSTGAGLFVKLSYLYQF